MRPGARRAWFPQPYVYETKVKKKERIICGLDVGTWKTCMIMARALKNGKLEMVSSGFSNSYGLAKGVVVNLEEVVASIRRAVQEAESKTDISANCVVAGISGNHIKSHNFHGVVEVQGKNGEVTSEAMIER
jgi:cell division protein FtsA